MAKMDQSRPIRRPGAFLFHAPTMTTGRSSGWPLLALLRVLALSCLHPPPSSFLHPPSRMWLPFTHAPIARFPCPLHPTRCGQGEERDVDLLCAWRVRVCRQLPALQPPGLFFLGTARNKAGDQGKKVPSHTTLLGPHLPRVPHPVPREGQGRAKPRCG